MTLTREEERLDQRVPTHADPAPRSRVGLRVGLGKGYGLRAVSELWSHTQGSGARDKRALHAAMAEQLAEQPEAAGAGASTAAAAESTAAAETLGRAKTEARPSLSQGMEGGYGWLAGSSGSAASLPLAVSFAGEGRGDEPNSSLQTSEFAVCVSE